MITTKERINVIQSAAAYVAQRNIHASGINLTRTRLHCVLTKGADLPEVHGLCVHRVRAEEQNIELFVVLASEDMIGAPPQANNAIASVAKILRGPVALHGDVAGRFFGRDDSCKFLTKAAQPTRIRWTTQEFPAPGYAERALKKAPFHALFLSLYQRDASNMGR